MNMKARISMRLRLRMTFNWCLRQQATNNYSSQVKAKTDSKPKTTISTIKDRSEAVQRLKKHSKPKTLMSNPSPLCSCNSQSTSTRWMRIITREGSVALRCPTKAKASDTETSDRRLSQKLTWCCRFLERSALCECSIDDGSSERRVSKSSSSRSQQCLKKETLRARSRPSIRLFSLQLLRSSRTKFSRS